MGTHVLVHRDTGLWSTVGIVTLQLRLEFCMVKTPTEWHTTKHTGKTTRATPQVTSQNTKTPRAESAPKSSDSTELICCSEEFLQISQRVRRPNKRTATEPAGLFEDSLAVSAPVNSC